MNQHSLELALVLPDGAHECAPCAERLLARLAQVPGLDRAHLDRHDPAAPKLCLHYDPAALDVAQLLAFVHDAVAAEAPRVAHISVPARGLRHERQARLIEGWLARQPGVRHAAVSFGMQRLALEFDPGVTTAEALLAVAARAGLSTEVEPAQTPASAREDEHGHEDSHEPGHGHGHSHGHGGPFGERSELVFSLTCGALTALGWGLGAAGVSGAVTTALFVAAYAFGSWFTVQEVAIALRARTFEVDFLMLLAALGAAALGEWFEGALLLFLFTLGHALEGYAMGRARRAIEALAELVPETALREEPDGRAEEVPVDALVGGDRVLVKPHTRVPADGFVLAGAGSVNQAPLTGESVPVDKHPVDDEGAALAHPEALDAAHRVFAGSINGAAALSVVVTKRAADSTLARIATMVADAESQKSPTQQFTDRFERYFVPLVLGLVVLLLFAWVVLDEPFSHSFYRAMAVLVAASPCALAIATPSAVLAGVARAARAGILVKGGAHLEALGQVRAIAFDKTGTLTEGKPKLTDVIACDGDESELLTLAAAVEQQSDHPLARAVVEGARARAAEQAVPEATHVEALIGFGVRAQVEGRPVTVAKPGWFAQEGPLPAAVADAIETLQRGGRTLMVVRQAQRWLGVLGVMDAPRESARPVLAELHRLGIEQTVMLTGDNQRVADAVAKQIGLRVARGDLLPEQKVAALRELERSSGGVAMVGDGVNDAPAMAHATVGIAMGASGSDVALETADVALMADDLRALPFAVSLSRAARSIIRQNLWASLGMVAFLIPATVFDFAKIGVAVALHEGSTLLVVANALRLLAYKRREPTREED